MDMITKGRTQWNRDSAEHTEIGTCWTKWNRLQWGWSKPERLLQWRRSSWCEGHDKSVTLRRERINYLDASGFPVSYDGDGERVVSETRIHTRPRLLPLPHRAIFSSLVSFVLVSSNVDPSRLPRLVVVTVFLPCPHHHSYLWNQCVYVWLVYWTTTLFTRAASCGS